MKLSNNAILTWQGYKIKNLFKLDLYHISRFVIQLVTLSRDTHTAMLKIYKNKYYLYQANAFIGVHIIEVSRDWLLNQLKKGSIIYHKPSFEPKINLKSDILVAFLHSEETNIIKLEKYNYIGLFNQFFINVFGISPLQRRNKNSSFCSELVMKEYFTDDEAHLYSPYKVRKHFEKLRWR